MLFDTHAHLTDEAFSQDREAVIASLVAAGVCGVVNCGYDELSCYDAINLANEHGDLYAAVGMHPHAAKCYNTAFEEKLKNWMQLSKVVALGEIGLDYHYDHSRREVQRDVFLKQIQVAKLFRKPIIVHSREAVQDTYGILKENITNEKSGVLHSFSQTKEMLYKYLDIDMYISVSGIVTFKNASNVREMVRHIPIEKLLIETDCPYMTPIPFRGKRNSPVYVKYVAEKVAEIKEMSYEEICEVTTANAYACFQIK